MNATNTTIAIQNAGLPVKGFLILDVSFEADAVIANADIATVADLKGKSVAFEAGSTSDLLINDALRSAGEPLRSRNPVLAVGRGLGTRLREGVRSLRQFRRSYREALERWRQGVHAVLFPYGTWWMVRHHGASMALPGPAG